jgi:LPS sulfotransferase NodH
MSYKPFIVVGLPRTGSSLLITTIQQHPAILTYSELFHPVVTERSGTHAIRRDGAALYFDDQSGDPIEFLKRWVWTDGNADRRAVGFKVFAEYVRADSTRRLFERLRDEIAGLTVLHIRRVNYLDVYLSRLVASKTGSWISYSEGDPLTRNAGDIRLAVSPEAATRFFQAMVQADAYIEEVFRGECYLTIDYGNLCRNIQEQVDAIFGFLGVETRPVTPAIQKQLTARKEDIIVNYENLVRHFSGTPYEAFFASDDSVSETEVSSNVEPRDAHQGRDSPLLSLESLDETIANAVNDGLLGVQGPPSPRRIHTFLPGEPEAIRTLARSLAARGNLERVNGVAAAEDLTIRRSATAWFVGWCCRTEEADGRADSRYFFLECEDGQLRYYVHLPSRIQRDDVAQADVDLPNRATRFSGFDFVADLQHLQPGDYHLGVAHEANDVRYEYVFANKLRVIS